jgi:hypothetical protein
MIRITVKTKIRLVKDGGRRIQIIGSIIGRLTLLIRRKIDTNKGKVNRLFIKGLN